MQVCDPLELIELTFNKIICLYSLLVPWSTSFEFNSYNVFSVSLVNITGGLPCTFEGVIESPIINGYRNKCEFSVGYSVQGKPTVGFMLGNFRY